MDRLFRAHDLSPVRLPYRLMAEADTKHGDSLRSFLDNPQRDSGLIRRARAGRDDYSVRVESGDLLGRNFVVAPDEHLGPELPKVLDQVVRKGVVVVYNQNPHSYRDCSKQSTMRQNRPIGVRMTLFLTEGEVESLLDMRSTLDAVENILRQQAEGRATNRARRRVALPGSGLNVMFAGAPEIGALGLKAYSAARSGFRFYTMLFDPESGELLSIMQSDKLGQMRTGAASGVATKHLARENAATLGIYGAGWQAESQLEAIAAVRDLERIIIYSRREESRKEFAEKMGERLGMEVESTHSLDEPAAQDIVATATTSGDPVLLGECLRLE